jgi:phytoene dehydrogenase-like protein
MNKSTIYDAVIIGSGHNGLVAANYLASAGWDVLVLEKNDRLGGATYTSQVFPGVEARLSVYSYLISLLPNKILSDLDIRLPLLRRSIASYTPVHRDGRSTGLIFSNLDEAITRQSFRAFTGNEREYERYRKLQEMLSIFAQKVWPTLLQPLMSKADMKKMFRSRKEGMIWEYIIERPLGELLEEYLIDDDVRGAEFTDGKIGVLTDPGDPSLLQNRTFIYHVIGQGTGEWLVPRGGMGALVDGLASRAASEGVQFVTQAQVFEVVPGASSCSVQYLSDGQEVTVDCRYVLFNTSADIANRILPGVYEEQQVDGSVFKINMVLRALPPLKDKRISPNEAFTGTLHFNESYEHMKGTYRQALQGVIPEHLPGEIYCHSLTDPSILSKELQERGFQTMTLFGLDVPYSWFLNDNEGIKKIVTERYLSAINEFIEGDLHDFLAVDANGSMCVDAKSPVDLENDLGLPRGNIFHGSLTWPFAEREEEAGTWGVETQHERVLICGSSAKRGGAVSGIPGHNAAMKLLQG